MKGTASNKVDNIINGLGLMRGSIESQVLAGLSSEQAHTRMFESYQARIMELPRLDTENHMKLVTAIGRTPWTADQKQSLLDVLQSRAVASKDKPKQRSALQSCEHFENFIPDELWENLKNTARTNHAAAMLIAQHGSKLGLVNASELTLRRMIAIVGFVQHMDVMDQE